MATLIRLENMQEMILGKLIDEGYYKTKSEAIRAAVLELGKEYNILQKLEDDLAVKKMQRVSKEINEGKRKTISNRSSQSRNRNKKSHNGTKSH